VGQGNDGKLDPKLKGKHRVDNFKKINWNASSPYGPGKIRSEKKT
jgi:hypothetical protein